MPGAGAPRALVSAGASRALVSTGAPRALVSAGAPSRVAGARCFHCGAPVPAGTSWGVQVDAAWRPMCCAGCQAVAAAIVGSGLQEFYSTRAMAASPAASSSPIVPDPESRPAVDLPAAAEPDPLVDDPLWQRGKVAALAEDGRTVHEAMLLIDGMVCAACTWLIEQRAARVPGVVAASANYATGRMRVRWLPGTAKLSAIIAALREVGYAARVYTRAVADAQRRAERKRSVWRLFVAALGMMQVMMYAVPLYLAGPGDMSAANQALMRWAGFALTLPVMFYAAAPFFAGAWRDLRGRRLGMDVPVALGLGVAFGASTAALTTGGETYFDSITMFVFLLLGGRHLELVARDRAARWIDAACASACDDRAERFVDYPRSQAVETIALARLRAGDVVLVRRGAAVPADGVLLSPRASVDESLLTGESRPIEKAQGADLLAGSIAVGAAAVARVTRTGSATSRAAIERLMESAMAARPPVARLADRFAGRITWVTLLVALAVGALWWPSGSGRAIHAVVAVLIATCPCALALATPLAVVAATARLAAHGVIVASPAALETLSRITRIVFDKTGTVTDGRLEVVEVRPLRGLSRREVLDTAAAMEAGAHHPAARAIRDAAAAGGSDSAEGGERRTTAPAQTCTALEEAGTGVSAAIGGRILRLGTAQFAGAPRSAAERSAANLEPGESAVVLADADGWLAVFTLRDHLRREAGEVVGELSRCGLGITLLSGDVPAAVHHASSLLGIGDARAAHSPAEKRAALLSMQQAGEVVAMVGDGVNDAPVLAQAHCAISLSGAAALAQSRADLILLSARDGSPQHDAERGRPAGPAVAPQGLRGVPLALATARRMRRIVAQNLWWSFAYNVAAVPLAACGLLPAWLAGIGMASSSFVVILNSMRLLPSVRRP